MSVRVLNTTESRIPIEDDRDWNRRQHDALNCPPPSRSLVSPADVFADSSNKQIKKGVSMLQMTIPLMTPFHPKSFENELPQMCKHGRHRAPLPHDTASLLAPTGRQPARPFCRSRSSTPPPYRRIGSTAYRTYCAPVYRALAPNSLLTRTVVRPAEGYAPSPRKSGLGRRHAR